ncbi:GDP-mannose 4,6-dehydratase [uncultured Planococcus sp.]|uniref:GDP-mannose 4,6-dehydratase n=1 Tax=uncultured Planococcus sp. TaxID=337815 RepID=UPI00262CA1A5|nr:GDP-mannose 4,6-dehydratase [uncultured Planococcus sp.]
MSAKTILITGGHGFIGSNMIHYYLNKYPDYQIVNIDYNTEAANPGNIHCPDQKNRYAFRRVDIRNVYAINHLFEQYDITDILHFAAETRSRESVGEIRLYEQTNVLGTMNLLYAAQSAWMDDAHQPKPAYKTARFHHISLMDSGHNTLYTLSKANADEMIQSFHKKYGLNIVTTASPEIFGPMQQDDALVPLSIQQALDGKLEIPGTDGKERDWLFVSDLCEAIDTVFHLGDAGKRYETGSIARLSDKAIVQQIHALSNGDFPGNNLDTSHVGQTDVPIEPATASINQSEIPGFEPSIPFRTGLSITRDWYTEKYKYADLAKKQ